jgi:glycosyltransferase involved in cell wall biosynthesis
MSTAMAPVRPGYGLETPATSAQAVAPAPTLKVRVYPQDDSSGHYRLALPMRAVAAHGHDVAQGVPGQVDDDTDVVVIHRPIKPEHPGMIRLLREHGIAVLVDMDDDFDSISPRHQSYAYYQDRRRYAHECCELADLVTCATRALIERYGYGHGLHIPNYIPASLFEVRPKLAHREVWVGWTGSMAAHPDDPAATRGALATVLGPGAEFAHIGRSDGVAQAFGLRKPMLRSGQVPLADYEALYACLDVAVVPLAQSPFNDAKSWLKGLQAAALGIPFVASPTADYRRLYALGAGLLARTRKDWVRHLTRLIRDPVYRRIVADAGSRVARELTIERNWTQWAVAYRLAAQAVL